MSATPFLFIFFSTFRSNVCKHEVLRNPFSVSTNLTSFHLFSLGEGGGAGRKWGLESVLFTFSSNTVPWEKQITKYTRALSPKRPNKANNGKITRFFRPAMVPDYWTFHLVKNEVGTLSQIKTEGGPRFDLCFFLFFSGACVLSELSKR